jgi:hypothetical protein
MLESIDMMDDGSGEGARIAPRLGFSEISGLSLGMNEGSASTSRSLDCSECLASSATSGTGIAIQ